MELDDLVKFLTAQDPGAPASLPPDPVGTAPPDPTADVSQLGSAPPADDIYGAAFAPPLPTVPPPDIPPELLVSQPPAPAPAPVLASTLEPSPVSTPPVAPIPEPQQLQPQPPQPQPQPTATPGTPASKPRIVLPQPVVPALATPTTPKRLTPREQREKMREARRSVVMAPLEELSDAQLAAATLPLRGLNPTLPKYLVRVTFLDESTAECEVTEDWTVGDLVASVANGIGLGAASALFHLCEGLRNSSLPLSSTNFERWLPRAATLPECGITAQRARNPALPPLVFRMHWFRVPVRQLASIPAMAHQIYLHVRRSLTQESVPLDKALAVELAALQYQAKWGDWSETRCPRGAIADAPPGTFFSSEVLASFRDVYKAEAHVFEEYKQLQGLVASGAEERYVRKALTSSCPLTGGTVYEYQTANGVKEKAVALRDGIAFYIGGVFRFIPFVDLAGLVVSPDGTRIEATILTRDPNPMKGTEKLSFAVHEPRQFYDLVAGFLCLVRPMLPPAAIDTSESIVPPTDLPCGDLFEPYPLRENILVAPSVAHYFWKQYLKKSHDAGVATSPQFSLSMRPVLRPFNKEGFNEYEYLLSMSRIAKAQQERPLSQAELAKVLSETGTAFCCAPHSAAEILPFAATNVLDLSHLPLKKQQLVIIAQALADASEYMEQRGIAQNFTITTLNVSGLRCGVDDVISALDIVCKSKLPLRRIVARQIGLTKKQAGAFANTLLLCQTLTDVDVSDNALGNEGVAAILGTLVQDLPEFDGFACSNTGITSGIVRVFQNATLQKRKPTRLRCSRNSFGRDGAKQWGALIALDPPLKDLDLTECGLDKSSLAILDSLATAHSLVRLRLGSNKLCKVGVQMLASSIADGTARLELVDLSAVPIKKKEVLPLLDAFGSAQSACKTIVLDEVPIPKNVGTAFSALAGTGVRALRLRGCKLSSAALADVAALVDKSETLAFLDISCNTLSDEVAPALAAAVAKSRTLTELDVSFCDMSPKGIKAFLEGIVPNTSLLALHVCGSRLAECCLSALVSLVNAPASVIDSLDLRKSSIAEPHLVGMLKAVKTAPAKEGHPLRRLDLRGVPALRPSTLEPYFERLRNTLILM